MRHISLAGKSIFISLFSLAFSFTVAAESSVWKASKDGNHLFLGGTIHILAAEDYPLPCEFGAAYSVSDKLFFETDVFSSNSPELAQQLIQQGTYPFGDGIDKKLSPQTLANLKQYLGSIGLPSAGFMKYKPGLLLTFVTIAELNKVGMNTRGVEQYFHELAQEDQKPVGFFEEPTEQIEFLVNLGLGNEENFVKYIVDNADNLSTQILSMRETWRSGDIQGLAKASEVDVLRRDFPKVFQSLISQRNEHWLTEIDQLIRTTEIEYILVGALHMAEPEGLLARLTDKGYQIDQVSCVKN